MMMSLPERFVGDPASLARDNILGIGDSNDYACPTRVQEFLITQGEIQIGTNTVTFDVVP